MFNRIKRTASSAGGYVLDKITVISNFLFGDLAILLEPWNLESKLQSAAKESPNGIGIIRIGPPLIGRNFVYISPQTPRQAEQYLKQLMDLKEESARDPYGFMNHITDSSVILSMNNEEGSRLRRKMLAYFNPALFHKEASETINQLLAKLFQSSNIEKEIKTQVRNLFSRIFLGSELDNNMHKILNEIDEEFGNYILLPGITLPFISQIKKWRRGFDTEVQKLLRQIINNLRKALEENSDIPNNLLTDTLIEKCGSTPLNELSDSDINRLTKDREVRFCVSLLLGVNNISQVIYESLTKVIGSNIQSTLLQEMNSTEQGNIDPATFRNKKEMPYLHAVYLEALRENSPATSITRYTSEGISTYTLSVPANSVIIYDLVSGMRNNNLMSSFSNACTNDEFQVIRFKPERYLTEQGQLNDLAKLHQGVFAPFGVGKRRCPATEISEIIFKNFILSAARNLNSLYSQGIQFSDFSIPLSHSLKKAVISKQEGLYQSYIFESANSTASNIAVIINSKPGSAFLKDHLISGNSINNYISLIAIHFDDDSLAGADIINATLLNKMAEQFWDAYEQNKTDETRDKINSIHQVSTSRQLVLHFRLQNNPAALKMLAIALTNFRNGLAEQWMWPYESKQNDYLLNDYMSAETQDKDLLLALKASINKCAVKLEPVKITHPNKNFLIPVPDAKNEMMADSEKCKNGENLSLSCHSTLFIPPNQSITTEKLAVCSKGPFAPSPQSGRLL